MWYLAIFSLFMGLVCGYLIFRFSDVAAKKSRRLDTELKQTKDELVQYRAEVNKHFSKTAELVNAMTADYRAMYGHLAEGAQHLCDGAAMKLETMNPADTLLTVEGESLTTEETSVTGQESPEDKSLETATEDQSGEGKWQGEEIVPAPQTSNESSTDTRIH